MNLLVWRKSLNLAMLSLTGLCTLFVASVLFFILGYLAYNGAHYLSWNFSPSFRFRSARWAGAWPTRSSAAASCFWWPCP